MNLLTDNLPYTVSVNGRNYRIVTHWKDWVRFCCMLEDPDLRKREKTAVAMRYFTDEKPDDIIAAVQALLDFSVCKDIPHAGIENNQRQAAKKAACFSWIYDAPFVLSAFRQCYNIDLSESNMHWYVFLALFQGLPEDVPLKKRIQLRAVRLSGIKDRDRRLEIIRAQEAIALPHTELQESEIDGNIFDGFFMEDGGEETEWHLTDI